MCDNEDMSNPQPVKTPSVSRLFAVAAILRKAGYGTIADAAVAHPSNVEHHAYARGVEFEIRKRDQRTATIKSHDEMIALCKALGLSMTSLRGVR